MSVRNKWMGIPIIVGVLATSLFATSAPQPDQEYVILSLGDIVVPIALTLPKPDMTHPSTPEATTPSTPHFDVTPPTETYDNSIVATVVGESGSKIYVNDHYVGVIGSSGKANVTLDTSGEEGDKTFHIVLVDASGNRSQPLNFSIHKNDPRFTYNYKGLHFYYHDKNPSEYVLPQLTDADFNALSEDQKLEVADNLLETLFFGYSLEQLKQKIHSGTFISDLQEALNQDTTDKEWLERYIVDERYFFKPSRWGHPQTVATLTRFYAMDHLDKYYFENWMAYILGQTILFSPAEELDSTHAPDVNNVYRRLVRFIDTQSGIRYTTYIHMMSQENWRRFRSPEDNGREMLEIYNLDMDDSHVPIAAQALQNWHLNQDSDTLEVGMNENREPLHLFNTTIYNGDDFFRELVKTDQFIKTVTTRLVDFFFPKVTASKRSQIIQSIVSSHPETFKDILAQIIFSKEYLLHNKRPRSAEEVFFSLAKRIHFNFYSRTFFDFNGELIQMHQASLYYKLGKLDRVPLDTLSFAVYHKYIRERMLIYPSNPDAMNNYDSWNRKGWDIDFIDENRFNLVENNPEQSLENFINYLFESVIARKATQDEMDMFKHHMLKTDNGEKVLIDEFNLLYTNSDDPDSQIHARRKKRIQIAEIVLDYLSRLEELYTQMEVH